MNEIEFRDRWRAERPIYDAWGRHVSLALIGEIGKRLPEEARGKFIRIPVEPRVKQENSLISKAFYRGKEYQNPYEQITDKVGCRMSSY